MNHCWMDERTWAEETFGFLSPEYLESDGMNICLLEDGHEGEHEWTDGDKVTVTFRDAGEAPHAD